MAKPVRPQKKTPSAPLKLLKAQFGANLKRVRDDAGLSQEELGFRAEMHRTEIGLLERGLRSPRLLTILKLTAALEIPPSSLIDDLTWPPTESDQDDQPRS